MAGARIEIPRGIWERYILSNYEKNEFVITALESDIEEKYILLLVTFLSSRGEGLISCEVKFKLYWDGLGFEIDNMDPENTCLTRSGPGLRIDIRGCQFDGICIGLNERAAAYVETLYDLMDDYYNGCITESEYLSELPWEYNAKGSTLDDQPSLNSGISLSLLGDIWKHHILNYLTETTAKLTEIGELHGEVKVVINYRDIWDNSWNYQFDLVCDDVSLTEDNGEFLKFDWNIGQYYIINEGLNMKIELDDVLIDSIDDIWCKHSKK